MPGVARPLGGAELADVHARFLDALGGRPVQRRVSAGDETLAFAAWQAGEFHFAERFDLAGGLLLSGRSYFDRLALAGIG
jgi:hypothetical protein